MIIDLTPPKLLVIGNGFDINLGLKTGYTDFIKSFDFNNILSNNKLCQHLKDTYDLKNWIDIERELKEYSNKISWSPDKYEDEFNELSNALKEYIKSLDLAKIDYQSQAFLIFKKLLKGNLNIINFNYTETISELVKKTSLREGQIKNHIGIHGNVKSDNIIFGIEDAVQINNHHIFLRKSYAKNFGKHSVQSYLYDARSISFFGLSMGESDHSHFTDFFMRCGAGLYKAKEVNFYYYGVEGYKNLMQQIDVLTQRQLGTFKSSVKVRFIDLKEVMINDLLEIETI